MEVGAPLDGRAGDTAGGDTGVPKLASDGGRPMARIWPRQSQVGGGQRRDGVAAFLFCQFKVVNSHWVPPGYFPSSVRRGV